MVWDPLVYAVTSGQPTTAYNSLPFSEALKKQKLYQKSILYGMSFLFCVCECPLYHPAYFLRLCLPLIPCSTIELFWLDIKPPEVLLSLLPQAPGSYPRHAFHMGAGIDPCPPTCSETLPTETSPTPDFLFSTHTVVTLLFFVVWVRVSDSLSYLSF